MGIAADAVLGGNGVASTSATIAFTTTSAVATGGFIVLEVSWYASAVTLNSVSGGGLSWTIDKQGASTTDANAKVAIVSAQAPSGLASGTTITATLSATSIDRTISGASFTGVATSTPVDGTPTGPTNGTTTAWATASSTLAAGSMLVGANYNTGFTTPTSTPTSPSLEVVDRGDTDGNSATMAYRIEAAPGSYTVAGAWTATAGAHVTVGVAYLAAPPTTYDALLDETGSGAILLEDGTPVLT